MNAENFVLQAVTASVEALYGAVDKSQLQLQKTRKEFEGDYTLVTFPLLRMSRLAPEATAQAIGEGIFRKIEASGCDVVSTDCETCKWQIEMSTSLRCEHPITLLAQALA